MDSIRYRYETHLHTSETSKCGITSGADFASHYKSLGYTGIFVTDHFLNGNTTVSEDLPWAERIELFCTGYEAAKEKGCQIGMDVFFGWEYSFGWTHLLTYGLGKEWLLHNPCMLSWDLPHYCDRVHQDGGAVIHAHPFREGIEIFELAPGHVDAVEVLNSGRSDQYNQHALDYAASFGLPGVAGSDIHSIEMKRLCGMGFPQRLSGAKDYITAVRSGRASIIETRLDDISAGTMQEELAPRPCK